VKLTNHSNPILGSIMCEALPPNPPRTPMVWGTGTELFSLRIL